MAEISDISKLGLVASHKRRIKPGREYDQLFPIPHRTDPIINPGASVYKTLDLMVDIIGKTKADTQKLADKLKGKNLAETCHNIWDFCYTHIQYEQDAQGEEQLRRPARTWSDRNSGVDCDCFSIFVSSILSNLAIDHTLRICELNNKGYFQHVYVIVPIRNGKYITIDPVLNSFNLEAPGITKTHDKMIPVRYLNGTDEDGTSMVFGSEFDGILGCACQNTLEVAQKFTQSVKDHLQNTRRLVGAGKCSLGGLYDQSGLLGALDFALANSQDDDLFLGALEQLAPYDDELMGPSMHGIYGALFGEDLGRAKKTGKKPGVFTKSAAALKTVKQKVQQSKFAQNSKSKIQDVKKFAQKAGKAIIKTNPLVAAGRAGLLLALELNLFNMANQLRWAYATPDQLKRYGVSQTDAAKAKQVLAKVQNLFSNKLQGKSENLRKAILSGKQALHGLSGVLGEPVTAATGTAAASGFIAQIVSWIKQAGLKIKTTAENNPELLKKLANRLTDNVIKPKPSTTIKNNEVVETESTDAVPPDNSFPNSQEITNDLVNTLVPETTAQTDMIEPLTETQNTTSEIPKTDSGSGKSGGGMLLIIGAAAVALLALTGSSSNRSVSGLEVTVKRKTAKRKNAKKSKSTKTLTIK